MLRIILAALFAVLVTAAGAQQNSIASITFGVGTKITPAMRGDTFFNVQNAAGTILTSCDDCTFFPAITGGSITGTTETVTYAGNYAFPTGINVTIAGVTPTAFNGTLTSLTATNCTAGVCTLTGNNTAASTNTWTSGGTISFASDAGLGTFTDATTTGQIQMANVKQQWNGNFFSNTFKGFGLLALTIGGTDTLFQDVDRQVYNAIGAVCPIPSCASTEYASQLIMSLDGGLTWNPQPTPFSTAGLWYGTGATITGGTMTAGPPITATINYTAAANYPYGVGQNVQITSGTTAFQGNWTVTVPATCTGGACMGLQMTCTVTCTFTASTATSGSMIPPYAPASYTSSSPYPSPVNAPMWPSNDFTALGFVQYGQDYTCAYNGFSGCATLPDNASTYVYVVSSGGQWTNGSASYLARVKQSDIALLDPSKYQYFCGGDGILDANWSFSNTAGRLPNGQSGAFGADPAVHGTTCDAVPTISDPAFGSLGGNGRISTFDIQYIPGPSGSQGVYLGMMTYYPSNNHNPGKNFTQYTVWNVWQAQHPWGPWCKFQVQVYDPEGMYTPRVLMPSINSTGTSANIVYSGNYTGNGPPYTATIMPITINYNSGSTGNRCGF